MRILIAEDDSTSRKMLKAVLEKSGYEVVEAADGSEAWDAMQAPDAPQMAILDWMMPGLDGPEIVRRVRAMENEIDPYIIILTAKGEKPDIVKGLETGADDYIAKPFDPQELLARIKVGRRLVEARVALSARIKELEQALEHIKTLQGILPICSYCKKIRDDKGYWDQVEIYIGKHSDAMFSHSICPECMKKFYPELCEEKNNDDEKK